MNTEFSHDSVLLEDAVKALITSEHGVYIDGTFGRGGHSRHILERVESDSKLFGFDKDPQAIAVANELAERDQRFHIIHDSFANMAEQMEQHKLLGKVDGILLDLGVSSPQLDDADRGFSFMKDGPLDMRMDNSKGMSAQTWLAQADEKEIADVLWQYGEERFSRRIAKAIVLEREKKPITTTLQLAEIVKQANPKWEKHKNPATRSFQGIRIFINNELKDVEQVLEASLDVLKPGGRLVVISFHSLEDRLVKRFMRAQEKGKQHPRHMPVLEEDLGKTMRCVGKAIKPSQEEMKVNVRARSAVMRIAEKL